MSSSVTVVGGVSGSSITGTVSVPVVGLSSTAGAALQASLTALSGAVSTGAAGLVNDNVVANSVFAAGPAGVPFVFEITNTDSVGGTTSGSVSSVNASIGIASIYSAVIVQAPGTLTVNGSGIGNVNYVMGSASNVDLFTNGGNNSVLAAGGNDTLNLAGSNSATISGGSDNVKAFSGSDTVFATGSASVFAHVPTGFAGSLDFINSGSGAASVNAGSGSATVFGGSAALTAFGGLSGNNSLVGGSGAAFLVGGASGDTLVAGGGGASVSSGTNYLFAGTGNETLLATSVTGTNLFQSGSGADVISSSGSGTQYFFGSSGSATMTGATISGSSNQYFFGNATNSGGHDVITNFGKTSELIAIDGTTIATVASTTFGNAPSALVSLNDGTSITLVGVNAASITGSVGGTFISGTTA